MERERHFLGNGVSIYREWQSWSIEISRGGRRVRKSLACTDKCDALLRAAMVMKSIPSRVVDSDLFKRAMETKDVVLLGEAMPTDVTWVVERIQEVIAEVEAGEKESGKQIVMDGPEAPQVRPTPFELAGIRRIVTEVVKGEFARIHGNEPKESIAVLEAAREYLIYQRGTKGNTVDHVYNVEKQIEAFLMFAQVRTIDEITARHVSEYLAFCSSQSPKTRKDKLGIIKGWLHWAHRVAHYVPEVVADAVDAPRVSRQDVRYLGASEVNRLLENARGHSLGAIVTMAFFMGLRRGELLCLAGEEIDIDGRRIRVKNTKTGVNRTVPIPEELLPTLLRLPRKGKVFAFKSSGFFNRQLRDLFNRAGIRDGGLQLLRHTWVSHRLLLGHDPYKVAREAGHDYAIQQRHYAGYRTGDRPIEITYRKPPREGRARS